VPYLVLLLSYLKRCFLKPEMWDEADALPLPAAPPSLSRTNTNTNTNTNNTTDADADAAPVTTGSVNPDLAQMRLLNPHGFLNEARGCAELSVLRVYRRQDHYRDRERKARGQAQAQSKAAGEKADGDVAEEEEEEPLYNALEQRSRIMFRPFDERSAEVLRRLIEGGEQRLLNDEEDAEDIVVEAEADYLAWFEDTHKRIQ
jgi:hypothetical protein